MNCPFYGRMYFAHYGQWPSDPAFVLFRTNGNQCALITNSHSPCEMELAGETVDWKECRRVRLVRCEEKD